LTNETILNCSTFDKNIFDLKGRSEPNEPIIFQIQLRGSGKTKSLYDLGMKRDLIYLDFSTENDTPLNCIPFSTCTSKIKVLLKEYSKIGSFKEERDLTERTQNIMKALIFSCIIFHGLFKQIYSEVTPEFFLRYFLNGGQLILNDLLKEILDYDIYDIEQITLNFKLELMFAFDEVGCLVNCFDGKFLKKTITEKEYKDSDNTRFRGLFDVFSTICLKIKELKYYQSKNTFVIYKY
jgi:hypothetical protein